MPAPTTITIPVDDVIATFDEGRLWTGLPDVVIDWILR